MKNLLKNAALTGLCLCPLTTMAAPAIKPSITVTPTSPSTNDDITVQLKHSSSGACLGLSLTTNKQKKKYHIEKKNNQINVYIVGYHPPLVLPMPCMPETNRHETINYMMDKLPAGSYTMDVYLSHPAINFPVSDSDKSQLIAIQRNIAINVSAAQASSTSSIPSLSTWALLLLMAGFPLLQLRKIRR